jgi:hypothetical protein
MQATAVLASSCGADPARSCAADADCPADAFCHQGTCRADSPPVARIAAPASLTTNLKLVFDGSGSDDADPGDGVASWAWSVAPVGEGCDPVPATSTGPTFETRFTCPGQYQVELVVTDGHGMAGQPATLSVTVDQMPDPPTVTAGPPLALGHQCSGNPLLCTTVDAGGQRPFRLVATAASPAPGALTHRWTYAAPSGADPKARVTFEPGPDDPSPWVLVETDGTAMAGTWTFAVEVVDSRGAVAGATVDVTVDNRPPVIVPDGGPLPVPHAFDPGGPRFVAQGATPVAAISDPDGDPIVGRGFTSTSAGDGGNAFVVQPFPDHATFDIAVAYAKPADAAFLIGDGVTRSIQFTASDVNGGVASATWDVVVTNRPPRILTAVPARSVPHWFDPTSSAYLATAWLSRFVDDDGDPLTPDASTGSALCRAEESMWIGTVGVDCAVPWVSGAPTLPALAITHELTATVRDPWSDASAATSLTVTNRPPRFTGGPIQITTVCITGTCCDGAPPACYVWSQGAASGTSAIATPVVDDDGDPISIGYGSVGSCAQVSSSASYTCPSASCPPVEVSLCGVTPACVRPPPASGTITLAFTDGVDSGTDSFDVTGTCP